MKKLALVVLLGACDVADPPRRSGPEAPEYPSCRTSDDCMDGEACSDAFCEEAWEEVTEECPECCCDAGESCDANDTCRPTCTAIADCYPLTAYCASDGLCYGVEPGVEWNDCERAGHAAPMQASGPLLFASSQAAPCAKDPAHCPNNGNVCSFAAYVHDPDGDLPSNDVELYNHVFLLGPAGEQLFSFDIPTFDAAAGTLAVRGCFDEAETTIVGAMQLQDMVGHDSNALCFEGGP